MKQSNAKIVVMTVDSFDNQDIQKYSLTKFRELRIGDKDLNNGILILIAKKDKQINVKIGSDLKETINDAKADDIITKKCFLNSNKENMNLVS